MAFFWFPLHFYPIFLFLIAQPGLGEAKLLFLQSLFRHGNRSPTHLYPNDPNPVEVWPQGLGKLTQLGKRQHYTLGKQLRFLYSDFITSDPSEVFVNSTFKDRCLSSAESHLAGLYEPTPEWQFIPGYLWQPIPIHYHHKHVDKYLNPKVKCPRADEEAMRVYNSPPYKKFLEENEPMLKNLSSCAGETLTKKKASRLSTTLGIEMQYNLAIPSCFLPYYDQLEKFSQVTHNIIYKNPIIQKLRAGPLLREMINNMNMKIAGEIPERKFHVYSARDRNIEVVLGALGLFTGETPPYCSTLLLELHSSNTDDDNYDIRLLFFNSTRPEDGDQIPYVLRLPGCTEYCPLQYFENHTRPFIPQDWAKECGFD